jgi:hypothetical protein
LLPDFLQRLPIATVQAEALTKDGLLARVERLDHFVNQRAVGLFLELLIGRVRVFVLDDVGDAVGVIIANRRVQ